VILPDVNVLLYAFRQDSPRHADYHRWLERIVNADSPYGIAPQALASVIRISTHPRIYVQPSRTEDAVAFCQALMEPDTCFLVEPGHRHWSIFVKLCQDTQATGNLVQDAWFAALAIESGCEWVTTDRDYSRFPSIQWRTPF